MSLFMAQSGRHANDRHVCFEAQSGHSRTCHLYTLYIFRPRDIPYSTPARLVARGVRAIGHTIVSRRPLTWEDAMRLLAAMLALLVAMAGPAKADEGWPRRQVTIIVPFAAGGTADLFGTTGGFAINPSLYSKLPHDTEKDFAPVSLIARVPNLLVVSPSLPVQNMPELIAYLKTNPDKLAYGSSGVGSSQHLGAEFLATKTGTKMTHIPYRASNEIMNALLGGHIQLALD